MIRRVVLESPYRGADDNEQWLNICYARACLRDSLLRNEAPLASHLLYTQRGVLDDTIAAERTMGIAAGHAWTSSADAVVVYTDRGISEGVIAGINQGSFLGLQIERRSLKA